MRISHCAAVCLCGVSGLSSVVACTTNNNTYLIQQDTAGFGGSSQASGGQGSNLGGKAGTASAGGSLNNGSGGGSSSGGMGGEIPTITGSYEAEDAFHAGTAVFASAHAGFSGTGYLEAFAKAGAKIIFTVNAASDGPTKVTLHYRNQSAPKALAIHVNGAEVSTATLEATSEFGAHEHTLTLRSGLNSIGYFAANAGDPVNVDRLEIESDAGRAARGATTRFSELEAEVDETNGTPIGPDFTAGTTAANASGRKAVLLDEEGKYIEWTAPAAANAITVRFSLPDALSGGGTSGSLSLYVDGQRKAKLALSSKKAWLYGAYDNNLGFSNDPGQGGALMPFVEERFKTGELAKGAKIRVQRDSDDQGDVTVDLIDLELVALPYARPENSISVSDKGAQADDGQDDSQAFAAAVAEAKSSGKVVWIPEGNFNVGTRIDVDNVTVRGAGPWHSVVHGKEGHGGFNGAGDNVKLLDFAIVGDMDHRDNAGYHAGIDGKLGTGSTVQNLWIQGTKVGMWFVETDGVYISDVRIRDTYADGINFNTNVVNSSAEQVHIRNTGDDGLAIWAKGSRSDSNRFKFATVHSPYHANGIAIYGGSNHRISDCQIVDTVRNSAGIKVSTQFDPIPFAGTTLIERTLIQRAGGIDLPNSWSFGALFVTVHERAIDAPVNVRELEIYDSPFDAILFADTNAVKQISFEDVKIERAGGHGIHITTPGQGTFKNVSVSETAEAAASVVNEFTLTKAEGNQGW